MATPTSSVSTNSLLAPPVVGSGAAVRVGHSGAFGQVLAEVAPVASSVVEVRSGDTLIGLVKAHYRQQGLAVTEHQAYRLAHQVAADNKIPNADLIEPGQHIDFARLQLPALARSAPALSPLESHSARLALQAWERARPTDEVTASSPAADGEVLDKLLARAVDKGFVPSDQVQAVKQRIGQLAQRYNFDPDDFARLTVMESDGMNPQASNGRCYGIIQFCDGAARGAAAVGLQHNPRSILGMGLLQQLDLVDRYFAQSGLPPKGPRLSLDDLYLTVLMPAARSETRPDAPLPIPGIQSSWLHPGRDRRQPITRDSIVQGLHALTQAALAPVSARRAASQLYARVATLPEP
ncbi:MAG: hypothetical protein ACKODC_08460 [Limnohabitans sp.]